MEERLQKIIAKAGLASRRGAEQLIEEGRVTINGQIAQLGQKADPSQDSIKVNGRLLPKLEPLSYYVIHKPRGVLSSAEPQIQSDLPIVTDMVKTDIRLYPVGRLDVNSEGLILLTNDGELTNRITHPRYGHTKTYKVKIEGVMDEGKLEAWRNGVRLPDGFKTSTCNVKVLEQDRNEMWLRVVMGEGHKRQIRDTAEVLGHRVLRLIRTHIGPLELGDLPRGQYRELSRQEVVTLKETLQKQSKPPRRQGKKTRQRSK
jgi:23S rRNA pseudouridine2605 synthase